MSAILILLLLLNCIDLLSNRLAVWDFKDLAPHDLNFNNITQNRKTIQGKLVIYDRTASASISCICAIHVTFVYMHCIQIIPLVVSVNNEEHS